MRFAITKSIRFDIPHKILLVAATISTVSTFSTLWYISHLGMLRLILILLPAYFSTFFAFLSSKVAFLDVLKRPLDFGMEWFDGKRIFGDGKTFRGVLVGLLIAMFVSYMLYLTAKIDGVNLFSSLEEGLNVGFLAGFGAMIGDLSRSFFKRRIGLTSGEMWFIFDDIDFVIGAIFILGIYTSFPINFIGLILLSTITLRIVSNTVDFTFNFKKTY